MKRIPGIAAVAFIIVLAGVLVWQQRANSKLREDLASLRNQLEEARQLLDAEKRLSADRSNEAEARQRERSELLRLRNEVNRLKQAAKIVPANPEKQSPEPGPTTPKPITRDQIKSFSTNLIAEVNSGETVITGGWEIKPGTKTYAMITPTFVDPAGNAVAVPAQNSQITMQARFIEFSAEHLDEELASRFNAGLISEEELTGIFEKLQSKGGTSVLATPQMTTGLNMQGQLSVSQAIEVEGSSIHLGPTVDFIPNISANGKSMTVEIQTSINIGPE